VPGQVGFGEWDQVILADRALDADGPFGHDRARAAIESAGDDIDRDAVIAAWELALAASAWDGARPAWIHADLLRPNLLVDGGRLRAVIDWGAAGAGDPATDLIAAWAVFGPAGRETNPGMAALGRRTVGQVLADLRARGGAAAGPGPSARSR